MTVMMTEEAMFGKLTATYLFCFVFLLNCCVCPLSEEYASVELEILIFEITIRCCYC